MPIPPSIILLPGNMCDERLWRGESGAIVNTLGARAPVRDADFSRDDSIAAMAARTLEAIPGPIIAIGFSMGAIVAVEMWVQAPERIAGLVLLGYYRRAALGRITVPVLLGCGVEDTLCPPAWHADWAARIPDATLFTVPGAGHMLPLEAPLTLARHLDEWLTAKDIA